MTKRGDIDALLRQVVRLSRVLHRLKGSDTSRTYDRSANVLLLLVDQVGPLRVADLAASCHVDASTVSRQAAELVREGLLRRQADPADGRASLMALTVAGRRQVADLIRRRREFFAQVVADWDVGELGEFLSMLTRFVDDIELQVGATGLRHEPEHPNFTKVEA